MGLSIEVKGLKELDAELKRFTPEMQRKALSMANTAAGRVLVKAARANVKRSETGRLKRGIRTRKNTRRSKRGIPVHEVGVFQSKNKRLGEAWYGRLVETGTKRHEIKPKKKGGSLRLRGGRTVSQLVNPPHPGAKAKPWLAPAFRSKNKAMTEAYGKRLRKWIDKEYRVSRAKAL